MWAWVLLPFEVALVVAAYYFFRKTKQTSDMMHAAQSAWQTEVEAHLRSLVQELETLLDQAHAQGVGQRPRWFPKAEPTPAPAATPMPVATSYTFEHVLDDALTETREPVLQAAEPVATDEAEDPRYQEARRLHAAGFDEVTTARKTGLEREEVRLLLQWSPAIIATPVASNGNGHKADDGSGAQEATERKITTLVEYLKASEQMAAPVATAAAHNGTRARRKTGEAVAAATGEPAKRTPRRRRANAVDPKQNPASA